MKRITPIILSLFFLQCQQGGQSAKIDSKSVVSAPAKDPLKVYNLMGEELPPKQLTEDSKRKLEINLQQAITNFEANQDSLELIIWYGRRLAYLGRYLDAIDVYTSGIEKFPTSFKLRRHRGHRYISTRQLDKAIEDFEMAAYYSVNSNNEIEPDGIPNKLNKPLGNDKFNIWYHYGLAHYLSGRYDKAISAYKKCMEFSDNSDLLAATSYWLYMTYMKIGNPELATTLLEPINRRMIMVENDAYLDLLLLFKGEKSAEDLMKVAFPDNGDSDPTLGYGIGNWYQQQGDIDKANEIFLRILESPRWDAFGYLAAEAELTAAFPVPVS